MHVTNNSATWIGGVCGLAQQQKQRFQLLHGAHTRHMRMARTGIILQTWQPTRQIILVLRCCCAGAHNRAIYPGGVFAACHNNSTFRLRSTFFRRRPSFCGAFVRLSRNIFPVVLSSSHDRAIDEQDCKTTRMHDTRYIL